MQIEKHWQAMYRWPRWRGGPILNSAVSAVDIALWDIAGKILDAPIYQLLGGAAKDKIRLYVHGGNADAVKAAKARGFNAVKTGPSLSRNGVIKQPWDVKAEVERFRQMREAGATFKVTKNRLTKLALADTPYAGLSELFQGPTAIAYSDDPVAPAKVAVKFAKDNKKLVVLGGGMEEEVLDANGVQALATLPSLDELRGKLVGLLQAPATKIAGVLQAPGGQLARVVSAYSAKDEAA